MFNWLLGFIHDIKGIAIDAAFVFAFGNLIVSTALDLAFHGMIKVRLAGGSAGAPGDAEDPDSLDKWRADYAAGRVNIDPDLVMSLFNRFDD